MSLLVSCLDCGQMQPNFGRGLCRLDYFRRRRAGTLNERPRLPRPQRVRPARPVAPVRVGPTTEDLVDEAGISYRQLDYWVRKGYVRPENPTPGPGLARVWPELERRVVLAMARLVHAGLSPDAASRVARASGRVELASGIWVEVTDVDEPLRSDVAA